jgi:GLPGLI family protein
MKLLCSLLMLLFIKDSFAQEVVFTGKIEYIKETKLLSGEFTEKKNGASETFFNTTSYAFVQITKIDMNEPVEMLLKSMPKEFTNDSFEVARQRVKIRKQVELDIKTKTEAKTFISYNSLVKQSPKIIGDNRYCLVDTMIKINWELKEDTMTLEGLLCQKARGWFIDKYYTVWFAPSVPFAAGPLIMHGLPGIIVLATSEDGKTRYKMKSLTYPLPSPVKISGCKGEKQISNTEFMILQAKNREDMKQNMEDFKNKNDKK